MFSLNSNNLQKNKVQCPTTTNIKRCTSYNSGNDIYIAYYKRNVRNRAGLPAYIIISTVFNLFRRCEYYIFNEQIHRIGAPAHIIIDMVIFTMKI
jgi:hypothetical protein